MADSKTPHNIPSSQVESSGAQAPTTTDTDITMASPPASTHMMTSGNTTEATQSTVKTGDDEKKAPAPIDPAPPTSMSNQATPPSSASLTVGGQRLPYGEAIRGSRELYDLTGVINARPLDEMRDLFCRFRQRRGKSMSAKTASLRQSWNAFCERYNYEPDIEAVIEGYEASRERRAIGPLRDQCHNHCYDEHRICYTHIVTGCRRCEDAGIRRPTLEDWEEEIRVYPLDTRLQTSVNRLSRALHEARSWTPLRRRRSRPRSPERRRERPREERNPVPTYPGSDQSRANAPYSNERRSSRRQDSYGDYDHRRDDERPYDRYLRYDDPHDQRYGPRSSDDRHSRRESEVGHYGGRRGEYDQSRPASGDYHATYGSYRRDRSRNPPRPHAQTPPRVASSSQNAPASSSGQRGFQLYAPVRFSNFQTPAAAAPQSMPGPAVPAAPPSSYQTPPRVASQPAAPSLAAPNPPSATAEPPVVRRSGLPEYFEETDERSRTNAEEIADLGLRDEYREAEVRGLREALAQSRQNQQQTNQNLRQMRERLAKLEAQLESYGKSRDDSQSKQSKTD